MHVMMISGVLMTCHPATKVWDTHTTCLYVHVPGTSVNNAAHQPQLTVQKKTITKTIGKRKEKKRREKKKGQKQKKERKEKKRKEKKRKEKKRKEKKRKEKKRKEKKRKEKKAPFGVSLTRSKLLYRADQEN